MDEEKIKEILDEGPQQQMKQTQKKGLFNNKRQVKGKALSVWLIVMVLIFMMFTFGLGIYLGKELFAENKENNSEKDNTNTAVDDQNLVFDDNAKNKIDDFIEHAMDFYYEGSTVADELSKGITGLTKNQKELIAILSIDNQNNRKTLTDDTVPEKYKNDNYFQNLGPGNQRYEMPIYIFTDEYKRLFNEDYVIESEDYEFGGCPFVFKIDQELGNMYLSDQCGGTGIFGYDYLNYDYKTDNNYYYVYQYVAFFGENYDDQTIEYRKIKSNEIVDTIAMGETYDFNSNASKFETVKWTFDKNLNFVSTENLG